MAAPYDVIYPACDSDLFAYPDALDILHSLLSLNKHVSVSTKARLKPEMITSLAKIARDFIGVGKVLKVSVSVSSSNNHNEPEFGCPLPSARIHQLHEFLSAEIPTSLNIRPILENVPLSDYITLIENTVKLRIPVLLGEEYRPIVQDGQAPVRTVSWLSNPHVWEVHGTERYLQLFEFAKKVGADVFTVDTQVVAHLAVRFGVSFI